MCSICMITEDRENAEVEPEDGDMVKLADIVAHGATYTVSLAKLTGKQVKDIYGFISDPYGADATFIASRVVMDDGTMIELQGEHDTVLVFGLDQPNMDQGTLNRLYREANYEDEESDD